MGCRLPLTEGHQQPLGVERGAGPRKRHGAAARHTRGEKGEVSGPQGQTARVCACLRVRVRARVHAVSVCFSVPSVKWRTCTGPKVQTTDPVFLKRCVFLKNLLQMQTASHITAEDGQTVHVQYQSVLRATEVI